MVTRGSIIVAPPGGVVGAKPRPALVIQDDDWSGVKTVLVVPFTTDIPATMLGRPTYEPTEENGLRERSALMVDKLTPARRDDIGATIGRLSDFDLARAEEAIQLVLGLI